LIATIARLLCRGLTLQNQYLREENRILKSKVKGCIRFDDDERRSLVDAAVAMGRERSRLGTIHCDEDLGGLLKSYRRVA
jgi:hypothetical protein